MTDARPTQLMGEERPQVEISPNRGWRETWAMVIASVFALAFHAGVVLILVANFSLFELDPLEDEEDLEQQVIAIVEIAPPPEPQNAAIDIGLVNQGSDVGDGEAAATGDLAALEPEPGSLEPAPSESEPLPDEVPPAPEEQAAGDELPLPNESALIDPLSPPETQQQEAEAEPVEAVAEVPLADSPEVPLPEASQATAPQEQDLAPPPLSGPPSELPEFALLEQQADARDISAEVPKEPAEDLTFDTTLTEVLVTAAIEREAEDSTPSGPLAVPPGKPEREVTLPPVPRPVTPQRQRTTRAKPSDRESGRQARNDSQESGEGGGFGGGSEANYLGQVARVLNRQKVYPPEAKIRGEEGRVIVRFTLDEEGWVIARRVLRSSGHTRLDEEVMDLLIRASPLPPPPGRQERLTLTLTLRFYAS